MQQVENELDNTLEKLGGTNVKLDEKDKAYQLAEGEAAALQRKYVLITCFHESWIFDFDSFFLKKKCLSDNK